MIHNAIGIILLILFVSLIVFVWKNRDNIEWNDDDDWL